MKAEGESSDLLSSSPLTVPDDVRTLAKGLSTVNQMCDHVTYFNAPAGLTLCLLREPTLL